MRVVREFVPVHTLEEFANKYNLTLTIRERNASNGFPVGHPHRFYASFSNLEIKDGGILISETGNGATPEEAVNDYIKHISEKPLIKNALSSRVPIPPCLIVSSEVK